MDDAAIEKLLAGLTPGETGWTAKVPADFGRFLSHPVGLDIQTRHFHENDPLPPPDEQKLVLARQVLRALPQVLAIAEREANHYADGLAADPTQIHNPHLWLSLDEFEDDGPGRWAFVVERQDWPDYGVHVEFDGLKYLEMWGGD